MQESALVPDLNSQRARLLCQPENIQNIFEEWNEIAQSIQKSFKSICIIVKNSD